MSESTLPDLTDLLEVVGDYYRVGEDYFINELRTNHRSMPRHVAMWIAREKMNWTWDRVADTFKRWRATVIRNVGKVEELRRMNEDFMSITDCLVYQLFVESSAQL